MFGNATMRRLVLLLGLLAAPAVHADIYKYVDENGRVTYTNVNPRKGAQKVHLEPINTVPAPKPKAPAAAPAGFPRVDDETQKRRDEVRRKILEDELAAEEKLLAESKQALSEGEAVRLGPERNNYQKYLDRVQQLKDTVTHHEKNVEALKKEIANLK
jgi:hypothetical protein